MRNLELVPVPGHHVTSYIAGGATRKKVGYKLEVPSLSECRTVSQTGGPRWRLSPATLAAFESLQADWISSGGEPIRLTDCWRDQVKVQADLRKKYDTWKNAGEPSPSIPGSGYAPATMSTVYAARPGFSNHGWGGAIDFDVGALLHGDTGPVRGTNEALAHLWDMMGDHGFSPVIVFPKASQSEAWHIDHLELPGRGVRIGSGFPRLSDRYGWTAATCCMLAGTYPNTTLQQRIQAQLIVEGLEIGLPDGVIGPMTIAGLIESGVPEAVARGKDYVAISKIMNDVGVGAEYVGRL